MVGLWLDVRHSARRLLATPGFTAAAVLTIALGIGLNTGVFSLLNGIFFSGLPVPAGAELVDVFETVEGMPGRNEKGRVNLRVTTSEYEAYRGASGTLAGLAGYSLAWPALLGGDSPRQLTGRYVTCTYFDVLRQPAAAGRGLAASDCAAGAEPVVMLGHDFWQRAFGADPGVVGRTVTLNRATVTVVGIAAADAFQPDLERLDYFAPISLQPFLRPDRQWLVSDTMGWLTLIGRRAGDATLDEVRAELGVIAARLDAGRPDRRTRVHVERARGPSARLDGADVALAVVVALAPSALVLLLGCANIANLFLARVAGRAPEIAMRFSLGASRARVARQLLIEMLLVAAAGGALGIVLAYLSVEAIASVLLSSLEVALVVPPIALDLRVLSFGLALSVMTGVLAGLAPCARVFGASLHATARGGATAGRAAGGRAQGALIGLQAAVCMVLLVAAGLLLRGFYHASTVDPGFPFDEIAVVSGDLRDFGYVGDELGAFQRALAARVDALPGVAGAAYVAHSPWDERGPLGIAARADADGATVRRFARSEVWPAYFSTAGIPIVRGRTFTEAELVDEPAAVIVTEATARALWPGRDPLGRALLAAAGEGGQERAMTVVGVARDAQTEVIGETAPFFVYTPARPAYRHMLDLVVRTRADPASIAPEIRSVLRGLDPEVAMTLTPLSAGLRAQLGVSALSSGLASLLGALALALASVGIFGVVAYVVGRRMREIGIRLALGARPGDVLRAVLGRTMRPVVAGTAIGAAAAAAGSGVLSGLLFGISPVDPIGIGGAALFVVGVAFVASLVPARRGIRVDPMVTLREE